MRPGFRMLTPNYEFDRSVVLFPECPYCNGGMGLAFNSESKGFRWECHNCKVAIIDKCGS